MISVKPVEGTVDKETPYLIPAVVENIAAPFRMEAFLWVLMLKKVRTVKKGQSMFIRREVGRNPVEDNTDPVLMKVVDKIHKILGSPVPA
jgi:hypothetical protein